MLEKTISVRKTARYFILGEPGPATKQVWFACHGYGFLAGDFLRNFEVLNDGSHLVVAPEALHRFYLYGTNGKIGASWMTREDRMNDIADYIDYLDNVYAEVMEQLNPETVSITALGFSQGTATACRWALMGRSDVHRLVLWGGDFPPDIDWDTAGQRIKNLDVQLVYGKDDPYVKQMNVQQQTELLRRHRVNFKIKVFNGHHEIEPDTLKSLVN